MTLPAGPRTPGSPLGPIGPVTPCGPCGPVTPCGPVLPRSPGQPGGPGSPLGPIGPGSQKQWDDLHVSWKVSSAAVFSVGVKHCGFWNTSRQLFLLGHLLVQNKFCGWDRRLRL